MRDPHQSPIVAKAAGKPPGQRTRPLIRIALRGPGKPPFPS